jgi:uncharacterized protein (DUF849 family)
MLLQVGGSISFAPETEGEAAKWLNYDTRHMLTELKPRPDQVTIAINTSQMNVMELLTDDDVAGASGTHPADLVEFARRTPDGAVLTVESVMRHVAPIRTIDIAMGLHVRVGIEDNLWRDKGERMTSVQQVEQMARIARELGLPPNREPGRRGVPMRRAA